ATLRGREHARRSVYAERAVSAGIQTAAVAAAVPNRGRRDQQRRAFIVELVGVDALEFIFPRSQATHVTDETAVMIPQREILDPQKALPTAGYVIPPDRPVPSVQRD